MEEDELSFPKYNKDRVHQFSQFGHAEHPSPKNSRITDFCAEKSKKKENG